MFSLITHDERRNKRSPKEFLFFFDSLWIDILPRRRCVVCLSHKNLFLLRSVQILYINWCDTLACGRLFIVNDLILEMEENSSIHLLPSWAICIYIWTEAIKKKTEDWIHIFLSVYTACGIKHKYFSSANIWWWRKKYK